MPQSEYIAHCRACPGRKYQSLCAAAQFASENGEVRHRCKNLSQKTLVSFTGLPKIQTLTSLKSQKTEVFETPQVHSKEGKRAEDHA
jgi:hypothetical protein